MRAFWEGMLAGYGIAVPVGAIAILIVEVSLQRGFHLGSAAAAGAATADFLYASLAALAGPALAAVLSPWAVPLRVLSGLVLIAIGAYSLWRLWRAKRADRATHAVASALSGQRMYGQFLALTLLNPLTIAYFGSLILGGSRALSTVGDRAAFVAGAGLASLSWQLLLAGVGALAHRHLSPRFQTLTSVVGNLIVIGLGARILLVTVLTNFAAFATFFGVPMPEFGS